MFMLSFVAIVICFCDRVGFDRVDFGVSNAEGGVKIFIVLARVVSIE